MRPTSAADDGDPHIIALFRPVPPLSRFGRYLHGSLAGVNSIGEEVRLEQHLARCRPGASGVVEVNGVSAGSGYLHNEA